MTLRTLAAMLAGCLLTMVAISGTRGVELQEGRGVLARLKVGRPVSLKAQGSSYLIEVMDPPIATGKQVTELGNDYVVVTDLARLETRIPLTAIKAVQWLSLPR